MFRSESIVVKIKAMRSIQGTCRFVDQNAEYRVANLLQKSFSQILGQANRRENEDAITISQSYQAIQIPTPFVITLTGAGVI